MTGSMNESAVLDNRFAAARMGSWEVVVFGFAMIDRIVANSAPSR
jgi:hypothetical protein